MPYRRSIYIGIGGLGIRTISKVKECFVKSTQKHLVPPMIQFIGIDTDIFCLNNAHLSPGECVVLQSHDPYLILYAYPNNYSWLPDDNKKNVHGLRNHGAGQIRSNGRFAFELNKNSIQQRILHCYHAIVQVLPEAEMCDIISSPNIDIHIVTSLAGGTGSGIVVELAKLIKGIIPNTNIMGYFFSQSFFENVFPSWNIKPNAYAALFELNCEMSSQNKPFETCVYIDNNTNCNNGTIGSLVVDIESAVNSTARTMYLISSYGDASLSFFDDVKIATGSGAYDVAYRKAWITGIGSCALSYNVDEINNCIYHLLATEFLRSMIDRNALCLFYVDDANGLFEKICESYSSLETLSCGNISPTMIKIEDVGSIRDDERIQLELRNYRRLLECEAGNQTDNIRHFLSGYIVDLLQGGKAGFSYVGRVLEQLLDLLDELINEKTKELDYLCERKKQLEHTLDDVFHEWKHFFFRRDFLKNEARHIKFDLVKKDEDIARQTVLKESFVLMRDFCLEMVRRINSVIQKADCVGREIYDETETFFDQNVHDGLDINLTPLLVRQLNTKIEEIKVNWDEIRRNMCCNNLGYHFTKDFIIDIISHNTDINTIEIIKLLINTENVRRHFYELFQRSETLLNLGLKGEKVLQSESIVITTPLALEPFVRDVVVNQLDINQFEMIIGNENEIRVCRKTYLYAPCFIETSGYSADDFSRFLKERNRCYSPFTDKKYIAVYDNTGGF